MSLVAALITGSLLGMRHAIETDHVAAVAALVSAVEAAVGFLLIVLGVRLLAGELVRLRHAHDDAAHDHVGLGPLLVGLTQFPSHGAVRTRDNDNDHDYEGSAEPSSLDRGGFAVGAVHGLAGSGAFVVALVAAAPSVGAALAVLGGFSVLSVLTMAVVSALWGRALDTRGRRLLVPAAGVAGVVSGSCCWPKSAASGRCSSAEPSGFLSRVIVFTVRQYRCSADPPWRSTGTPFQ